MKLNGHALGLSAGLLWGLSVLLATLIIVIKSKLHLQFSPGAPIGPHLELLGQFYRGYSISFFGSIIGFIYGFINGYIGGVLLARIYNRFAE